MADTGRLGIGSYTAAVLPRGGGKSLGLLNVTSGSWSRALDRVSAASVVAPVGGDWNEANCALAGTVRAIEHELAIFRDERLVWVGPIVEADYGYDDVRLSAADLLWWMDHRVPHRDQTYTAIDLALIFNAILADAFDPDPVGVVITATPTGIKGDRRVIAAEVRPVGDILRELLRTGVDVTVLGRQVRIGGEEVPATPIATLTDDHLAGTPRVTEVGSVCGTKVYVRGASGILGVYGGIDPRIGLVELPADESSILDQPSADAAAKTRWDLVKTPPLLFAGGTLKANTPITINELVPGARLTIELTAMCRPFVTDVRLSEVRVDFDGEGETVSITTQPIGTV